MSECDEIVIDNGREKFTVHGTLIRKCPSLLKATMPGELLQMPDRSAEEIRQLLDVLDGRTTYSKYGTYNLDIYRMFGIPNGEIVRTDDFIHAVSRITEQYLNGYGFASKDWFDDPVPWCGRGLRFVPCLLGCCWANRGTVRFTHPDLAEPLDLPFIYGSCDEYPQVSGLRGCLLELGWTEQKIGDLQVGRTHWGELQRRRTKERSKHGG